VKFCNLEYIYFEPDIPNWNIRLGKYTPPALCCYRTGTVSLKILQIAGNKYIGSISLKIYKYCGINSLKNIYIVDLNKNILYLHKKDEH